MIHKAHNHFRIGTLVAVLVAAITLCASAQIVPSTISGSISGYIYGPDGKVLGGTRIWANIVSPVPRPVDRDSDLPVPGTVTAHDGSFALYHVPAGDYVLCASNAAAAALNPCTWGGAQLVKMANGQHAAGQAIRMDSGATLRVHLDDPGGLLAAHAGKPGASLIVGLAAPHGFLPLPIAGSTANSRDYELLVPFNTAHTVAISSQYFKLTDAAGVAINAPAHNISVSIPSGMPIEVINLRIVGAGN